MKKYLLITLMAVALSAAAQQTPTNKIRANSDFSQVDNYLIGLKRLGIPTSETDNLDAVGLPQNTVKIIYNTTLQKLRVYNPLNGAWADAIDLSAYYTKSQIDQAFNNKFDKSGGSINGSIDLKGDISMGGNDHNILRIATEGDGQGANAFISNGLGGSISFQGYNFNFNGINTYLHSNVIVDENIFDANGAKFLKQGDALPLTGGTLNGALIIDNGAGFPVTFSGNDVTFNTGTFHSNGYGNTGNYFTANNGFRVAPGADLIFQGGEGIPNYGFNFWGGHLALSNGREMLRFIGEDIYAYDQGNMKKFLKQDDNNYIKNISNYNFEIQDAGISISGDLYSGQHYMKDNQISFTSGNIKAKTGEGLQLYNAGTPPLTLSSFETLIQGTSLQPIVKFDAYKVAKFYGQVNISENDILPSSSVKLHVSGDYQGALLAPMTQAGRDSVGYWHANVPDGLEIFNTSTGKKNIKSFGEWKEVAYDGSFQPVGNYIKNTFPWEAKQDVYINVNGINTESLQTSGDVNFTSGLRVTKNGNNSDNPAVLIQGGYGYAPTKSYVQIQGSDSEGGTYSLLSVGNYANDYMRVENSGFVKFYKLKGAGERPVSADADGNLMVSTNSIFISSSTSAPTPTSDGIKGQVIITSGYRYECIDTNTWRRVAIETTW